MSKSLDTIVSPGAVPEPGSGLPRRAAYMGDSPMTGSPENGSNIWELFETTCSKFGDRDFLGHRPIVDGVAQPYAWESYNNSRLRSVNIGSALVHHGIAAETKIGILSVNCPEWILTAFACYRNDFVPVPLYDTLGAQAVEHIVNQTELQVLFVSAAKLASFLAIAEKFPSVQIIVTFGTPAAADVELAKSKGNKSLLSLSDLEAAGAANPCAATPATADSIAMICYTSGTTGPPKGAVILHRNFIACSNCLEYIIAAGKFTKRYPTDTHFSYLPLAHVFEFDVFLSGVQTGMRSGFYQGDPTQLMSDIQELKPSSFITVPRVMNRIYDQVWSGVRAKGGITKAMFQAAFASKVSWLKAGRIKSLILDAVVFAKMRALLGGNIKFILCSSAPLAPDVIQFFRVCFSVDVFEGYGQTECSGAAAVTWAGDYAPGHVGTPNPCSEFKLFDVPSMNYTSADLPHPRGEICVRGNNVFQGYYKDPVKTAEAIDADGWLHTGDVGMWDERGRLVVIDRVKNLFKLSQGEYVSPERVESVYQSCPLVAQAYVHGDSLKSSTVGIMVPDIGELLLWAVAESFLVADPHTGKAAKGTDIAALLARQEVATAATKAVQAYGKAAGLKGFENVRAAHWEPEAWTVENNQLTPTFKLKRQDARAKYEPVFEALYKSIGE